MCVRSFSSYPSYFPIISLHFLSYFPLPLLGFGLSIVALRPQSHDIGTCVGFPHACSTLRRSPSDSYGAGVVGKESENPPHRLFSPHFPLSPSFGCRPLRPLLLLLGLSAPFRISSASFSSSRLPLLHPFCFRARYAVSLPSSFVFVHVVVVCIFISIIRHVNRYIIISSYRSSNFLIYFVLKVWRLLFVVILGVKYNKIFVFA